MELEEALEGAAPGQLACLIDGELVVVGDHNPRLTGQ